MYITAPTQSDLVIKGKQGLAWKYLNDNVTTEVLYGGAAGGGKSFLGCLWHINRRVNYPETRGLIGRADISTLEQSTLITFFKVCGLLGYQIGHDFKYNSQKHIINWSNGSQTILKDLFQYPSDPDFINLGSTEYTDAFVDELTEISQKAYDIVNSRLRWMVAHYGLIPKIFGTCNPGPGWVKETYLFDKDGKKIQLKPYQKFVRALVTDNPDKDFVKLYSDQLLKMHSDYDRERLLYGNWDVQDGAQNPFAFQYDPPIHESYLPIHRPDKQLYISIDFNLNPFAVTFWHFWKNEYGWHWHGIDEAEIDNGSIPAMIDLIRERYGKYLHSCIITGDAMGNQGNMARRDNASHYQTLMRELHLARVQVQVPANPTHQNSRDEVNRILYESKQPGSRIHFAIHPKKMPNTSRDMRYVQCDAHGSIIKGNRKDINQRGDYIDTTRYLVHLTAPSVLKYLK